MSLVIVVDDEKSIRDALAYSLKAAGFQVESATTLKQARAFLARSLPDLIVLDLGLPDGDGLNFLRELRQSHPIPVLILSARGEELDRVLGFELGGDDYVVKPFSPREVVARVRAILRRSGSTTEKPAFEHDAEKQQIRYFGTRLDLTRYEYEMLRLLLERPGWVFSRQKIMDLLWEHPLESTDRTVDTHIKTLRSKLKTIRPDLDPIETRRGAGYALKEVL